MSRPGDSHPGSVDVTTPRRSVATYNRRRVPSAAMTNNRDTGDGRISVTIRFDRERLNRVREYAATSRPRLSINEAAQLLMDVGLLSSNPDRLTELVTLARAIKTLEKLEKRLDTPRSA